MSYNKHVFFCTNQRANGASCCNDSNSIDMREYAKKKAKNLGIHGLGKIRINSAGCLGQCVKGPVIVVYPDNVWYQWANEKDIDEVFESHLLNNKIVERLLID